MYVGTPAADTVGKTKRLIDSKKQLYCEYKCVEIQNMYIQNDIALDY